MILYIDGGSRGNPGPAGFGVRVEAEDGRLLAEISEAIGVATNNVAEYRGLLAALRYAVGNGASRVLVRSDSLLLVKQMRGEYRVKHANLKPLVADANRLVRQVGHVDFEHIRREFNTEADALANQAMDNAATPGPRADDDFRLT
jgi:ribonuclease HI